MPTAASILSLERGDFGTCRDATGGGDRESSGRPERRKICEIGASQCSFAIYIGAQKCCAEPFQSRHDICWMQGDGFAPPVSRDFAVIDVESDHDLFARERASELVEESLIDLAVSKDGAANDDLPGAEFRNASGPRDGANAAAYADVHFVFTARAFTERCDESVVLAFIHGRIEIDDMEPFVAAEFFQLCENVGDGEFATAAVDELDRLAGLQINARDQHAARTSLWMRRRRDKPAATQSHTRGSGEFSMGAGPQCVGRIGIASIRG